MKPFIFTGDSFTWGEGIELYDKNIHDWIKPIFEKKDIPYRYDITHKFSSDGAASYIRGKYRYAQLVSNHFNTFFATDSNGGSNTDAFRYINELVDFYESDNFSYVIMNLTSLSRDQHIITRESLINDFNQDIGEDGILLKNFIESWYEWCSIGNFNKEFYSDILTFEKIFNDSERLPTFELETSQKIQTLFFEIDEFIKYLNTIQYNFYKDKFNLIKSKGHEVKFIGHWNEYDSGRFLDIRASDIDFISNNSIPIEYDNKVSTELSYFREYSELWIDTDLEWTLNQHPSKLFHQVIADSIIKYIENLENSK